MIKWVFVLAILGLLFNSIFAGLPEESCGVADPTFQELPSDGSSVPRGSWPWLVAIMRNTTDGHKLQCCGTLISKRLVLTSASCTFNLLRLEEKPLKPEEIVLYVGKYDRNNHNEEGSVQYGVELIILHPEFLPEPSNFDNDIALLVSDRDIEYTDFIRPACVWEGDESIEELIHEEGSVVGWGHEEMEIGKASNVPNRKKGRPVSRGICLTPDPVVLSLIPDRLFCIDSFGGSVPCSYDSGSGFMLKQNGRWTIRGISALFLTKNKKGTKRCDSNSYTLCTDVAKFKDWLAEEIKKYSSLS